MLEYPEISPEILRIGPIAIRWYGLMYVIGFVLGFHIIKARMRRGFLKVALEYGDSYVSHVVIGMLIGARLVFVFVYNWDHYSMNLAEIPMVWLGGLSFHGAAIGMIVASIIFAYRHKVPAHSVLDALAISAPIGLFFGRIGNFINGELYGRASDLPWAMVFPSDPSQIPRHPSQLYQGLTEGLLLFVILCVTQKVLLRKNRLKNGILGATFILGYGTLRFFVEFTREPDAQLGFVFSIFSMGQVLCFLMIVASMFQFWHIHATQDYVKPKPIGGSSIKENFLERFLAKWVA